ncbi:MAG: LLM class F420-dependent oxidoreductase [Pseudonocardiaceae bacterium]
MRDFRFSFNVRGVENRETFEQRCRSAQQQGYDTVFAADHLGLPAPFPLLVAASAATERLRVGTLVLNAAFWNPALLAREVATTDVLTGGRLEVGLGAGHMKWEFDEAGIDWQPFGTRAEALRTMISELGRFFQADFPALPEGVTPPRPVQRHGFGGTGPPLIVGGTGDRILRIAAEHADIVSVAGVYQLKGQPPGTFRLGTAAQALERVRFTRDCAGARAAEIEWHLLVQAVVETRDRRAAAKELIEKFGISLDLTVEEGLETPFLLIGTAEEMAGQLHDHRERYGFSYLTVHEPFRETFAPVIELLRR